MKIEVTQTHIDKGVKREPDRCPIALALGDAGFKFVLVQRIRTYLQRNGISYFSQVHDKKTENFVKNFDYGTRVEPFSFELYIKDY